MDKIIYYVKSLLFDPNPYSFLNGNAAILYKENKSEYEKTVRNYTSKIANFETTK